MSNVQFHSLLILNDDQIDLTLGDLNVAKFLIENNSDVNAKTNDGRTPLHVAAHFSECIKILN